MWVCPSAERRAVGGVAGAGGYVAAEPGAPDAGGGGGAYDFRLHIGEPRIPINNIEFFASRAWLMGAWGRLRGDRVRFISFTFPCHGELCTFALVCGRGARPPIAIQRNLFFSPRL